MNNRQFVRKKDLLYFFFFCSVIILSTLLSAFILENQAVTTDPLLEKIKSSNLPVIYLKTIQEVQKEEFVYCTFHLFPNSSTRESISSYARIRMRGHSASIIPKKSYRLELLDGLSLLDMRVDDDWDLHANYNDFTRMHAKIAYDLWRNIQNTSQATLPDSRYVVLFLNGDFLGLYLLAENFDRKLLDLSDKQDGVQNTSLIIQAQGGGDFTNLFGIWEQQWPDLIDVDKYLIDQVIPPLVTFINTSSDEVFFDPVRGIYSIFNKQNLIDFFIYNNFIIHEDFWTHNYYLVKDSNQPYCLVPWDFEGSFGLFGPYFSNYTEKVTGQYNKLFDRLMNNQAFIEDCKHRWNELRESSWTDAYFNVTVTNLYEQLEPLLGIEFDTWYPLNFVDDPDRSTWYPLLVDKSLQDYLTPFFDFIPGRLAFLDQLWSLT